MAKQLRIHGLVQGVGYRASFMMQARALRLAGWVRNRPDGSVEALIRGDAAALQQIIAWAHRGPSGARVREVQVEDVDDATVTAKTFNIA